MMRLAILCLGVFSGALAQHKIEFHSQSGTKVVDSLAVGETLSILVPVNDGTGFEWMDQSNASEIGGMAFADSKELPPKHRSHKGQQHEVVFHYKGDKASSTPSTITMEYTRPWDANALKQFVHVTVAKVTEKISASASSQSPWFTISRESATKGPQTCTQVEGGAPCRASEQNGIGAADMSFDASTGMFTLMSSGGWSYAMSLASVFGGGWTGSFHVGSGGPFETESLVYSSDNGVHKICHNTVQCCTTDSATPEVCCSLKQSGALGPADVCYTLTGSNKYGNSHFTLDAHSYGKYTISSSDGNAYFKGTKGKFTDEVVSVMRNWAGSTLMV